MDRWCQWCFIAQFCIWQAVKLLQWHIHSSSTGSFALSCQFQLKDLIELLVYLYILHGKLYLVPVWPFFPFRLRNNVELLGKETFHGNFQAISLIIVVQGRKKGDRGFNLLLPMLLDRSLSVPWMVSTFHTTFVHFIPKQKTKNGNKKMEDKAKQRRYYCE